MKTKTGKRKTIKRKEPLAGYLKIRFPMYPSSRIGNCVSQPATEILLVLPNGKEIPVKGVSAASIQILPNQYISATFDVMKAYLDNSFSVELMKFVVRER